MAEPRFPVETSGWPKRLGYIDRAGEMVIPQDYAYNGWSASNPAGYAVVTPPGREPPVIIDTSGAVRFRLPPNHASPFH